MTPPKKESLLPGVAMGGVRVGDSGPNARAQKGDRDGRHVSGANGERMHTAGAAPAVPMNEL